MCDALVEKRHASSMSRFLSSLAWDEDGLMVKYLRKIRFMFSRKWVSVIIDDTLSEKTGKNIEGVQFHKDHTGRGFVFGHQFVTALLRSRDIILPLVPQFYSKKTQSKIQIAHDIILLALNYFHVREVILDSWYVCEQIIDLCRLKKIDLIGAIKSNRKIWIKNNWVKLNKFRKRLTTDDFKNHIIDDETYRVYELITKLNKGGLVKILLVQQWIAKDKKWSRTFFLISTNTNRTLTDIIRTYTTRWSIETFHRDAKQNLGLGDYHMQSKRSITRHLMLVTFAYAILQLWMFWKKLKWTIGEAVRYLQGKNFDDLIITIVDENDPIKRREIAQRYLSKNAQV